MDDQFNHSQQPIRPEQPSVQPLSQPIVSKKPHSKAPFYVIIVVILLAAAGYGGYYYGHKDVASLNNQVSTIQSEYRSSQQKVQALQSEVHKLNKQSNNSKGSYLTINELGIKLPLTAGISDLVYVFNSSKNQLYFSTKSLDSVSSACTISTPNTGAFGVVTDSKSALPASEVNTSSTGVGTLYAQANGYYLYWKAAARSCAPGTVSGLLNIQLPLFQTALKAAVKS